jgi:nitronate monooxygenase
MFKFLGIEFPLIQAPMAGSQDIALAIAVANAGGLGSLPCALLSLDEMRSEITKFRTHSSKPLNVNFFCHENPVQNIERDLLWKKTLLPYYKEFHIDPSAAGTSNRFPFDDKTCELMEELKPEVISFHFGLPEKRLIDRVKKLGAKILSSATTVDEALWLEDHGCDAIIAQGLEAGGHRGIFLSKNLETQVGIMSLVPQIVDAVKVPVIAAGGIADERGARAAFALGASAIQVGTAYLFCPEARVSSVHLEALKKAKDNSTALTNIFTGRPARGLINRIMKEIGPMTSLAPEFPLAGGALAPLKSSGSNGDFMSLWSGQSASLCEVMSAADVTKKLGSIICG